MVSPLSELHQNICLCRSEDEARDYAPIDAWQKKHSPHGEPPKRRWPREKKRKGIGPPEMKAKLAKFDDMVPRLQAYKVCQLLSLALK